MRLLIAAFAIMIGMINFGLTDENCMQDPADCLIRGPRQDLLGGIWLRQGPSDPPSCYGDGPVVRTDILHGHLRFANGRVQVSDRQLRDLAEADVYIWQIDRSLPGEPWLIVAPSNVDDERRWQFRLAIEDDRLKLTSNCTDDHDGDGIHRAVAGHLQNFKYRWRSQGGIIAE